jgi:PHP family Zn ribbon phosphoesterase
MRIGGNGKHKMAKCSSCNHLREARTIDYVTKLCKMCTFKIKKGFQAGFEKSISNGGDYNGEDESREVDLYIGTSHIGGKRTY